MPLGQGVTQRPREHRCPNPQACPQEPQFSVSTCRFTQLVPHESMHDTAHAPRTQVGCEAVPTGAAGQAVHDGPHWVGSSASHCEPQRWNPTSHAKSQDPELQCATPFEGALHDTQLRPHCVTLEFGTQSRPQR